VSVTSTVHSTSTTVSWMPAFILLVFGQPWNCAVTVTDTAGGPTTPTGTVSFTANGPGRFTGNPCVLAGSGATAGCSVTYTPSLLFPFFTHTITASYSGDGTHLPSSGTTTVGPWLWWFPWL